MAFIQQINNNVKQLATKLSKNKVAQVKEFVERKET